MKEESVASPLKFVKMVLTVLVTGNRRLRPVRVSTVVVVVLVVATVVVVIEVLKNREVETDMRG